ncbi:MAG: ABC transporter ATP-binding protein [Deltaproteobacteria bacterium]|nr:ABC transporter ATP-binding protein [Deltaproteobacteria bacterium]
MLVVDGLTKTFGDARAVDGLGFTLRAGEVLGLVGPNGAGKTTTLRCLSGILRPDAGRIVIGGADMARDPVAAKARAAYVPDEPELFEYLTVDEHLALLGRLYSVPDPEPRAARLLERFALIEKKGAYPDELSRGMRRKLATACALLPGPDVLILDEPFTALDPPAIRDLRALVLEQAAAGRAVILSSHLLALLERLAHRFLLLDQGRLVAHGTLAELAVQLGQEGDLDELFERALASSTVDPAGDVPSVDPEPAPEAPPPAESAPEAPAEPIE